MRPKTALSRRQFLGRAGAALAATGVLAIVPRHAVAGSPQARPSDKINIACIGIGGQGRGDLNAVASQNIVALCDVDLRHAGDAFEKFPQAKPYRDFRKMLDEMDKSTDAVVVATPDHTHAVAAIDAIRRGKHVYCEKPLAHSVREVRALMKAAAQNRVVTQLGNQGHSFDSIRMFCEWVWDGAIGQVHTIHAGCGSDYSRIGDLPKLAERPDVPATLDWDLWLGPVAERPYHPMYLPGAWRSWSAFGTGVIGDWVCHVVDPVFWALDLGAPATVRAEAKGYDPAAHGETFPHGSVIKYTFPAKGKRGPVTLFWHDGVEKLPRPDGLEPERKVPDTGAVVLGDKGGITYGSHGAGGVRIYPETAMRAYRLPPKSIPRAKGHHDDWLDAIRNRRPAGSDFALYGGPLTEIALVGAIAIRFLGKELQWDGRAGRFTNCKEAEPLLNPVFRKGWTL